VRWKPWKPVGGDAPEGRLVAAAGADGAYLYAAANDGARWTLRVGGICDFLVEEGLDVVECRLDPDADPELVAVLLAGLAVAFLLGLAGHCVLHASAVELDGATVAFAGPSGSGKSTVAALLCAGGARLVTDDLLRLGLDGTVTGLAGGPHLRLRPGAAWSLAAFALPPPTSTTVDDRLAVRPTPSAFRASPLSAIVLPLLSREATEIDLRPVTGAESVTRLAAVCRVAGWRDPDVLRSQLRSLARVAAGVQVVEAVIPWGPAHPSAIVSALRVLARKRQ
jgi:hypothetical protein